jgi:hypothetical protein
LAGNVERDPLEALQEEEKEKKENKIRVIK